MFGVIYDVTIFIRTNPDHGYPETYETYQKFKPFSSEDDLINWVRVYGKDKKYKLIKFEELIVEETVSFKVKPAT